MVDLLLAHWLIVTQILGIWLGILVVVWLLQKIRHHRATVATAQDRRAPQFDQELLEQMIQHESERAVAQIRAARANAGVYTRRTALAKVKTAPGGVRRTSRSAAPAPPRGPNRANARPKKLIARHYAEAARLIACGKSVNEIQARVKIPTCEIELMQKFNAQGEHWLTGHAMASPYAG
jgi:hypothetical protein